MTNTTTFGKFILKLHEINPSITIEQAMELYNATINDENNSDRNGNNAEPYWTTPSGRVIPERVYSKFKSRQYSSAIRELRDYRDSEGQECGFKTAREDVIHYYQYHNLQATL